MNENYTDYGYVSLNHVGESLCGDNVSVRKLSEGSYIIVLADGLGSGIKANILSTLTSIMMSKMIGSDIDIEQCVKTIIDTLPVCSDRGVAYSTFSLISVKDDRFITIYNYDNPSPFIVREGKAFLPDYVVSEIHGKHIEKAELEARLGDTFFMMSDGVINAGAGEILNYGWTLPEVMRFMEGIVTANSCAKALATTLTDRCNALYNGRPGDDVTAACVRIRERKQVSLMVGPSTKAEDDDLMVSLFLSRKGMHAVCGGTTASIVARHLGKDIVPIPNEMETDIPPISAIEGIDLVTEGMVTLNRVLEYGRDFAADNRNYFDWNYRTDGASRLASLLFEDASDIIIFSGCAVNPAHQHNSELSISLKMKLIDELCEVLKSLDKNVKISYF